MEMAIVWWGDHKQNHKNAFERDIVTFIGKGGDPAKITIQAVLIILFVATTIFITNNGKLDHWMCGLIAKIITPGMEPHSETYELMHLMDNDQLVARHMVTVEGPVSLSDIWPEPTTLIGLTVRLAPMDKPLDFSLDIEVVRGAEIMVFGNRDAHHVLQHLLTGKLETM